jgi:rfaE bifunctional protein kinase chain/domain
MEGIDKVKILVVGDIMLDKYVVGDVKRISPEAPVPVVHVTNEYNTLGGCGNVVRNLTELGVQVDCLASIGKFENGQCISENLNIIGAGNFLFFGSVITTVKERIISTDRKVQMLRVDREKIQPVPASLPVDILTRGTAGNPDYDMIIVSDYAKGMITNDLMKYLKELGIKIIVDPKPSNDVLYNGVYMITPNEKEWDQMRFSSAYNLDQVPYILVTRGKNGMLLIEDLKDKSYENVWAIPAEPVDVYNVSGAGDTVVAVLSTCLSMGFSELDSAYIANKCAGYVVTQPGTSVVPKNKFIQIVEDYFTNGVTK